MRKNLVALLSVLALLVSCGSNGDSTATKPAKAKTSGATTTTRPVQGSKGCDTGEHAAASKAKTEFPFNGITREFLVTAPQNDKALPLVVDIHGLIEGDAIHAQMSEMGEYGQKHGFITMFPHGTGDPIGWKSTIDSPDVLYLDFALEMVLNTWCIDTTRIYATGLSMGAMMTSVLACSRSDKFAAFVPVNGLIMPEGCRPTRPVPILAFHGTADPILPFNGGKPDLSSLLGGAKAKTITEYDIDGKGYPETAKKWATLQNCTDPKDGKKGVEIRRVWSCPRGAEMQFDIIIGQGHGWPGTDFARTVKNLVGPSVDGVYANDQIWEFMKRYQLPA